MCNLNAFHPSLNIPSYVAASDRTTYVSCSHEKYYQWLRRKSKKPGQEASIELTNRVQLRMGLMLEQKLRQWMRGVQ